MVTKTPFKVIHISKTQFLEPNLVGFGRSIYDVGRWIKSGSKNLEKKKLEIFEVDFCNAVGTVNSSFQSLDLFNDGRGPFKNILNCRCWQIWKGGIWLKNLADWGVLEKKSDLCCKNFIGGKLSRSVRGQTTHLSRPGVWPLAKGWCVSDTLYYLPLYEVLY